MAKQESGVGCIGAGLIAGVVILLAALAIGTLSPDSPDKDAAMFCASGLAQSQRLGYHQGAKVTLGASYSDISKIYQCPIKEQDGSIEVIKVKRACSDAWDSSCAVLVD